MSSSRTLIATTVALAGLAGGVAAFVFGTDLSSSGDDKGGTETLGSQGGNLHKSTTPANDEAPHLGIGESTQKHALAAKNALEQGVADTSVTKLNAEAKGSEKDLGLAPNNDFLFDEPEVERTGTGDRFVVRIPSLKWHSSCDGVEPSQKFQSFAQPLELGGFSGAATFPEPEAMLDFNRFYTWSAGYSTVGVHRRGDLPVDVFVVRASFSRDMDFANETTQVSIPGYEEGPLSATEALALVKRVDSVWVSKGAKRKARTLVLRATNELSVAKGVTVDQKGAPDLAEFRNGALVRFVHKSVACLPLKKADELLCGCTR